MQSATRHAAKPVPFQAGCSAARRMVQPQHRARQRTCALQQICEVALTGGQAGTIGAVLKPLLTVAEVFFIVRIVMSWDPQYDTDKKLPWAIFYKPTEPVLGPTRRLIKPVGGVDISPIIWTFVLSLANEFLLGPQGIIKLIERQGGL